MQYSNGFLNTSPYNNGYMQNAGVAPLTQNGQTLVQPAQMPPVSPIANSFTWAWVQGEAGAQAYPVAPNTTVLLLDSDEPRLFMKSADASGKPQAMETKYLVDEEKYKQIQLTAENTPSVEYVTKEDFERFVEDANNKFVIRKEKNNNGK